MPLNIDDWRCYDKEEKNKLLKIVRKFSIPIRGEEFVKRSIGKKWKDYKCELKGIYLGQYKTKDALLRNRPKRIPRDQWIGLVSYWFSDKAKKRTQVNRINRGKQKMPHTGGSKSIATLMDELAVDGIEPSRAEIFLKIHKRRKDGRPLDEESANAVELIEERLRNDQHQFNEKSNNDVAWEGDLYSQVLGSDKSGYVHGLGLGPTPFLLWDNKASFGKSASDILANEIAQKLEQEIKMLKEKHEEEIKLMKENQDKILTELSCMRQICANLCQQVLLWLRIVMKILLCRFRMLIVAMNQHHQALEISMLLLEIEGAELRRERRRFQVSTTFNYLCFFFFSGQDLPPIFEDMSNVVCQ